MNVPRYASQAARLLSAKLGEAAPPPGDRARGTATLERAIAARQRSRGTRLVLLAAAAFLVFVGAAAGIGRFARPSVAKNDFGSVEVTVSPHGAGATLTPENAPLAAGARLVAGAGIRVAEAGTASVELSTGTRLELESAATVTARTLTEQQRFYLAKGALEARVAKLRTGQRFVVETPDAEIEVRGTEFRLEVLSAADGCGAGVRTRLLVREGVVEVRANGRSARIGAGGRWPDCGEGARETALPKAPFVASPGEHPSNVRPAETTASRHAKSEMPETPEPEPTNSAALVEQNDLFAEGVAARKRGDASAALSAYGRLIQKYPRSALVENAMVERMRLYGTTNPEAARREAERYLRFYPSGFARAEAERLLTAAP